MREKRRIKRGGGGRAFAHGLSSGFNTKTRRGGLKLIGKIVNRMEQLPTGV